MGYKIAKVFEHSMEPTVCEGDIVLFETKCKVEANDIVIAVDPEGTPIIKRIKDIDEETVFLVGDNPEKSEDSRHYGRIPIVDILGKVRLRWNGRTKIEKL